MDVGLRVRSQVERDELKWPSIVDKHTRQCVALKVARSITSEAVIDALAEQFAMPGVPRCMPVGQAEFQLEPAFKTLLHGLARHY